MLGAGESVFIMYVDIDSLTIFQRKPVYSKVVKRKQEIYGGFCVYSVSIFLELKHSLQRVGKSLREEF